MQSVADLEVGGFPFVRASKEMPFTIINLKLKFEFLGFNNLNFGI